MSWTVEVYGLQRPQRWVVSRLPEDSLQQDRAVQERFAPLSVTRWATSGRRLIYVARPPSAAPAGSDGAQLSLVTASGPDAGRIVPLARNGLSVGRGASQWRLADRRAPSRATVLQPLPEGISVSSPAGRGLWRGDHEFALGRSRMSATETAPSPLSPPVDLPDPEVDVPGAPSPLSLFLTAVVAVGPLAMGILLAVTTGQVYFLLFGLMSIVALAAMAGIQRRQRHRYRRRVSDAVADRAALRSNALLSPAGLSRACRHLGTDRFGMAGAQSAAHSQTSVPPPVLHWGRAHGEMVVDDPAQTGLWAEASRCNQPAVSTLSEVAVRVHGDEEDLAAVSRWIVAQLLLDALRHDRSFVTATAGVVRWWHRGSDVNTGTLLRALPLARVADAWRVWGGGDLDHPADPSLSEADMIARGWRVVDCDPDNPASGLTRADEIDLSEREASLISQGQYLNDLDVLGVSPVTLQWWVREIADDLAHIISATGAPSSGPLSLPARRPDASAGTRLVTALAAGPDAGRPAVIFDLVADGPHVLLVGTTGSGKSDLLLSVLVGLTSRYAPSELALILLDFKGGASFSVLEQLPHTMVVETNHVESSSLRALDAISAELRRREVLFARDGVSDYAAFRARHPNAMLPRLVVAIDELKVLMDDHPDAATVLQRLSATGRSLGFHLVMATQRATGTVTSDIRSNLGAVLCLRTATEQESWDIMGARDAAHLPADQPGSAFLVRPGHPPLAFRASAWVRATAEVTWRRWGHRPPPVVPSDWDAVIADVADLSALCPVPDPVVSPTLPVRWSPPPELLGVDSAGLVVALRDDTAAARHVPVRLESDARGSTAWIVEHDGGRSEVVQHLIGVLESSAVPLLILDGTDECAPLIGSGEAATTSRISARDDGVPELAELMEAVRDLAAAGGTVLITGWPHWGAVRDPQTYRGLDEELIRLIDSAAGRGLRILLVGGREAVTSRLMPHVVRRFFVPAATTAEQRMVWPRLTPVPGIPGRAVLVSGEHPEPGVPVQLAMPEGG